MKKQSELNIGTLGHVDHGKTTLTAAITHTWTDKHSESIKRSMTIKLGYADVAIRKCGNGEFSYTTEERCADGKIGEEARRVSLLDAPGHETLMATAIAGSSIIDAALFVISASEPCPMPQTKEHLMLLNALDIRKVIVVQTKIDVVGREKAKKHYDDIKKFIKRSVISDAPIIPVMANRNINVDAVLDEIMKIELPERDTKSDPVMYIARSFDVNKPGSKIDEIVGGVIGGSVIRGKFKVGDEIEIRPGISFQKEKQKRESYDPIITKIEELSVGSEKLDEAISGGLVAMSTDVDPTFTKADGLVGQIVGKVGKLPEPLSAFTMSYSSLNRDDLPKQSFRQGEALILGIGTGTMVGYVKSTRKNNVEVELKHQASIDRKAKISVLRSYSQRWRLSGYGTLVS